jgi:hypothetical protein
MWLFPESMRDVYLTPREIRPGRVKRIVERE